jgi:hypothetical protein
MSRAISLAYGVAAGAGLVQLGVPTPAVVAVGLLVGIVLELFHWPKGKEASDE